MREWIALHQEVTKILCESLPMNLVLDLPVSYREKCCQLDVEGLT